MAALGGVGEDGPVDLAEDLESPGVYAVLEGILQLFLLGYEGAVNVLRLDLVEKGLEGGKNFQGLRIDDLGALVEEVFSVPQETGHQGKLLGDVFILG
jgi:hypothetical protein